MLQNKTRLAIAAVLLLALVIIFIFNLRDTPQAAPSPTVNLNRVQTEAVATFVSELTGTAQTLPTSTITSTPPPTSTEAGTDAVSPTPSCYRLLYVRDVTIPDNAPMTPAQVFTKTWLVENSGLCAWRPGFRLILVGGLAMGGSPYVLIQAINPGDRIEVSIKMVAPTDQTGIAQGTWRMSDGNGTLFGDALTVVIDVGGSGTGIAPTTTAIATP